MPSPSETMTGDTVRRPQEEAPMISFTLIARRNLDPPLENWTKESMSEALRSLHTVRLDREKLTAIENLEGLEATNSLYLQQNRIKNIENLDNLLNLRFLTLAQNQIQKLKNLRSLQRLQFLDVSDNQIDNLDTGELPPSLIILHLTGNPCTNNTSYRETVLKALPGLRELDGEPIADYGALDMEEEENLTSSDADSSDEDFEFMSPLNTNRGFFVSFHQEILGRSERRRRNALREHESRIEEAQDLPSPPWVTEQSDSIARTGSLLEKGLLCPRTTTNNFKTTISSNVPKPNINAVSSPTKLGITKISSTRDRLGKASPSPATEKVLLSPTTGKTVLSPATGKASLSQASGKASPSLAATKVPSANVFRKTSPSAIPEKVPATHASAKVCSAVSAKASQSPTSKNGSPCTAMKKVTSPATQGKTTPSSAKDKAPLNPTRTPVAKTIPAQTGSRGPK
ncbi:leucine-rich repeat-containing protein 46 [Lissotriton helveticus]